MTMQKLLQFGRKITPKFALPFARVCVRKISQIYSLSAIRKIQKYYQSQSINEEISHVLSGIKKYGLTPFPYDWAEIPKEIPVPVFFDAEKNMHYVLLNGKHLYYPRDMEVNDIKRYHYFTQIVEQNVLSPHRYLTDDFNISESDIIADCGVAEGNFSLAIVDKVQKLYLFEPEERWMEPLHATFSPWKDKVEIVQTYLSDSNGGGSMSSTIDTYFSGKECPTFLKLDVEGYEERVLNGAKKCIESGKVKKIVTCAYHYADDEDKLGGFLRNHGYSVTPSRGYMVFSAYDDLKPPYFRRGLLRGTK